MPSADWRAATGILGSGRWSGGGSLSPLTAHRHLPQAVLASPERAQCGLPPGKRRRGLPESGGGGAQRLGWKRFAILLMTCRSQREPVRACAAGSFLRRSRS